MRAAEALKAERKKKKLFKFIALIMNATFYGVESIQGGKT
jgi:hypothetical protein